MEIIKKLVITEGDRVECLTNDGWEIGSITKISENKVTVFLDFIEEEREFSTNLIR